MYYFDIYKDEHNFKLVYFVFDYSKLHSKAHGHVGNKRYEHELMSNTPRSLESLQLICFPDCSLRFHPIKNLPSFFQQDNSHTSLINHQSIPLG